LNKVAEVAPTGVLGLTTIVATWKLASVVLAVQSSPFLPPVPSSQVMKTAVVLRDGIQGPPTAGEHCANNHGPPLTAFRIRDTSAAVAGWWP
jgi:hypothetical protein